jgi:hypothetical protein
MDKRIRVALVQDLIDSHAPGAARKEMRKAHSRLNDFVRCGIVPEDLMHAGGRLTGQCSSSRSRQ